MYVIVGGTGHVGSAVARCLLARHDPVTVVTHTPAHVPDWERRGARVAVADVFDTAALRLVFRQARRVFLLNPPADPSTDTDAVERRSAASLVVALEDSPVEKVVAQSTYGAQPTPRAGDLNVLYGLEQALQAQRIPASILRAAYYMSNWDAALPQARDEGIVDSIFPADFRLPMVAPADLGEAAAQLLVAPAGEQVLQYVEGPQAYSATDVAEAFARALGRRVEVRVTPRERWEAQFQAMGFSPAAAASYARMTAITLDRAYDVPAAPKRGATTLADYIADLVARAHVPA